MNHEDFTKLLVEVCKPLPGFRDNDSHIIIRCPNCEQHRDPDKHGHFYISKIKQGNPCDCKKCDVALKSISPEILIKLNINSEEVVKHVLENHKEIHTHIVNLDERNRKLDYSVETRINSHDRDKLSRLSDRLGVDISTPELLTRYRIISNLSKFLKKNGIKEETLGDKERGYIPMIDEHYVGFLSYYGNIVSFRNMSDNNKLPRYVTYVLDTSIKRSFMYTPAVPINPITDNPKIVVAEGAIDIISIHLNDSQFDSNNAIYVSSSSVGAFRRAIKTALSISGFFGATINLYLDNEELVTKINDYDFERIISTLRGFGRDFKVNAFINLSSKDFGDIRETITIGKACLNSYL